MNTFLRNTISKLYNAVSAPVAATRDALTERLQSVRDTASLLYNRMMENMGYGQERLKDIVEKDIITNITPHTQANITPRIEMRVKVIYLFKSVIDRGAGEIKPYSKTLDLSPGMFTSLKEIQAFIEECERKRFDLDNEEVWSKAYLPATRTNEVRGNYEVTVVFKNVQIRLVASKEPLMGCGRLPDWVRGKRCIYAIDKFDENFAFGGALPYTSQRIYKGAQNLLLRLS